MKKLSPDKVHGPIIARMLLELCKDIAKKTGTSDGRVTAGLIYRDAKGVLSLYSFVTSERKVERMVRSEALEAHAAHSPLLIKQLSAFCADIFKESQASGIRIACEFVFHNGKGEMTMKSFITPDGKTERMLDTEVLMPRGAKLQRDVEIALRKVFSAAERAT